MLRFNFLLILSLCCLFAKAQVFKTIEGEVLTIDNRPLQYATIALIPSMIGAISNENGKFQIKILTDDCNDSLYISCVGYKKKGYSVAEINTNLTVRLSPSELLLPEVVINTNNYKTIVKKAITNIKNNYPTKETCCQTHLNFEVKQNKNYISFFDGTLDIRIPDYSNYNTFFKSYLINKNINLSNKELCPYYYGDYAGNILAELFLTNQDFLENVNQYTFYSKSLTMINDDVVYEICFVPTKKDRPFSYVGKIYIDTTNYAILHLDYSLIENQKNRQFSFYFFDKKINGSKYISEIVKTRYKVDFIQNIDNKYTINFIDYESEIKILCKEAKIEDKFQSKCRFTFTDHGSSFNLVNDNNEFSLYSFKLKNSKEFKSQQNPILNRYLDDKLKEKIEELKEQYPDIEILEQ